MYTRWQLARKYICYYLNSSSRRGHGIHSAFVFDFITSVLNDNKHYPAYEKVESLRKQLLSDKTVLHIEDFGAGSAVAKSGRRTIASLARSAAKSKKFGQLLFRLVKRYNPDSILELGTSLGITTSYLALAKPGSRIITMEGAGEVADRAARNFQWLGLENISIIKGNFDQSLPPVINGVETINFSFIDGNHRREPTERYFQQLLLKINNDTILVVDDIHWSREMEEAWAAIKQHSAVRCTIDLFFVGIVFFRQEFREKQHFKIRF